MTRVESQKKKKIERNYFIGAVEEEEGGNQCPLNGSLLAVNDRLKQVWQKKEREKERKVEQKNVEAGN